MLPTSSWLWEKLDQLSNEMKLLSDNYWISAGRIVWRQEKGPHGGLCHDTSVSLFLPKTLSRVTSCLFDYSNHVADPPWAVFYIWKQQRQILNCLYNLYWLKVKLGGFPGGVGGEEPTCQCRRCKRCRFNPWVGKIFWRRAWQPTPVFLPRESPWTEEPGRLQSMGSQRVGHDWSDLTGMHTKSSYRKESGI